jgi:hypothetical protein
LIHNKLRAFLSTLALLTAWSTSLQAGIILDSYTVKYANGDVFVASFDGTEYGRAWDLTREIEVWPTQQGSSYTHNNVTWRIDTSYIKFDFTLLEARDIVASRFSGRAESRSVQFDAYVFNKSGTRYEGLAGSDRTATYGTVRSSWSYHQASTAPDPDPEPAAVPEPGSLALLALGLFGLRASRKKH